MSQRFRITVIIAVFIACLMIDYGLARAGNPQSVWVWRDLLGIID